ncbi:MAG: 16S rRNA (cytosine(1402)-N(4))-methyltransferase RsmH [Flavobacteriaceae bacterium]|nr:16S rRNA (cytosine(1402)-N(4))-methyltransferase RsmH [Flavobacteriaceae bacterium]MCY4215558.1 16S rRNA (cytosine(1402)-N(4))-methyltransferase RsmH [Flavobacteriaceae bacterium]MCY4253338.1 16S rRNA (cytosine(1402)-N(4))-methyltransferase RsmH [Flavobacteriaceae bacterium]
MPYHKPVLLNQAIDGLMIQPEGIYVDATYGAGGHAKAIITQLNSKGTLFGFDCDLDAKKNTLENPSLVYIPSNFKYIENFLHQYQTHQVDGILADFGVSSYQIDTSDRGFSFMKDGPLDMRMNQRATLTAKQVINHYDSDQLSDIFYQYGQLRNAKKMAKTIVTYRKEDAISTTFELKKVIHSCLPKNKEYQTLAKIFQAIRIEVNQELEAIKTFLGQCARLLKPKGRLVCISYHSLEDRLVKFFIQTGTFTNQPIKDFYGNIIRPFNKVGKLVRPTQKEIEINPRARSAKLRIAQKR